MTSATIVFWEVVLAIHIMAAVAAFGVAFAYPIIFAVAVRQDPRSLPLLHRIEVSVARRLINPGLLVVVIAGIYLASKLHYWSDFFVQWGIGAALVIGAVVGAVMVPASRRAAAAAERDLAATHGSAGEGAPVMSAEYRGLVRRLTVAGSALSLIVLITIFFMVTHLS